MSQIHVPRYLYYYGLWHGQFDEKNIRRRVYDAFNVLMAINVIAKDKKEIKWVGFPSTETEELAQIKVSFIYIAKTN